MPAAYIPPAPIIETLSKWGSEYRYEWLDSGDGGCYRATLIHAESKAEWARGEGGSRESALLSAIDDGKSKEAIRPRDAKSMQAALASAISENESLRRQLAADGSPPAVAEPEPDEPEGEIDESSALSSWTKGELSQALATRGVETAGMSRNQMLAEAHRMGLAAEVAAAAGGAADAA